MPHNEDPEPLLVGLFLIFAVIFTCVILWMAENG